ncbi:hypothetical protein ACIBQ1_54775 [Nonomuraea sp. NPDC050153]|uniref:hypothetical protein n=1 Tax=Nonomuraea sp. NPDC050153 TaxID=3364359 RepID=UPI003799DAF7
MDAETGRQRGVTCPRLPVDDDHGSWYFAVQVRGLDGQQQRVRQGGYTDSEEAEAAGRALAAADRDGVGAGCTLGQWLARWPATKDALRPSTRQGYAIHIRLYLIPRLGRIRLLKLTSRDVNGLLATLASRPSPTDRQLSPATVVRIPATLRTALNAAVRARLIPLNPANGAELPHPRRPHPVVWTAGRTARWQQTGERPAVAVWTEQQLPAFLTDVAQDRLAEAAARIDAALPHGNVLTVLAEQDRTGTAPTGDAVYPFLPDTWLRRVMRELVGHFGVAFGAVWRADPDRLLGEAVALLAKLRLVAVVEGGVLALPLLARYRGVTAEVKQRPEQSALFEDVK